MKTSLWQTDPHLAELPMPGLPLDGPQTLVLVFGDSDLLDAPHVLQALSTSFESSVVLGCSTAGQIRNTSVSDGRLTVSATQFADPRLVKAIAPLTSADDSFASGAELAHQLPPEGLRAVLVLAAGLEVNGSELVRGLSSGLPEGVVVTGGLAADGPRFERTWVLGDSGPEETIASAVGFYGEQLRVGHGSRGGWESFGPEREVTKSQGNVLFEIDGKPALELYKMYLGDLAAELPASGLRFPLALRDGTDTERQLVRTLLAIDEEDQSLTFAGDVPQGSLAQLMRATSDQLVDGAEAAAQMAADPGSADPLLVLAISCVGRRMVLGEGTEEELEAIAEAWPTGSSQVGFYSYGELSPFASGTCDLHNQTMTITTYGEVPGDADG